jgi:hypothetical protein
MSAPAPADPTTMLAHMQAAMQQMHQQMQQLQPQAAQAPAPRPPAGPKLPASVFFEGKSTALDEWATSMSKQFDWYGTQVETDRLRFAVGFLNGSAYDWWSNLPNTESDRTAIDTWSKLVDALRRRFQPVTTAEMARARLATLAQGKPTVHEYVSAFRRLLIPLSDIGIGIGIRFP